MSSLTSLDSKSSYLKGGIFLSQSKYAKELVKKFGLESGKPKRTCASAIVKFSKEDGAEPVDIKLYISMIGSLLYLTASMPDISYSVGVCARYQAHPTTTHLSYVKRIIKYIHGTSDNGILYSYDTNSCLVGYSNADWGGNSYDRKIT